MEELDENISDSISSRERRKTTSKVSIKLDKTSSASQLPRSSRKPSSKKKEFGCQVMSYGVDEATMTLEATQADELAKMIKIEAQKTIQMLEMFMNSNNSNLAILNDTAPSMNEIQQKTNEDLMIDTNNIKAIKQDGMESSDDEMDFPQEEDLFNGMDTQYDKYGSFIGNRYTSQEKKVPFSKYVEEAMKRAKFNESAGNSTVDNPEVENLIKSTLNFKQHIGRNEEYQLKESLQYLKKNKIRINRTHHNDFNPGKFFRVKLKPLQQNKEKLKSDSKPNLHYKSDNEKSAFISKKNALEGSPEYFYEFQLSLPKNEYNSEERKSLSFIKNKDIFDSINPTKQSTTKNADNTRNTLNNPLTKTDEVS